jgi:small-conductance mechanosensitive channel
MVKANRPWFLARRLYRVLVAAIGTGAYLVMSQNLWMLSGTVQTSRLIIATILSIGAMVTWIIVDHDLWEKRDGPFEPERARLYNTVTAITFTLGISVLYLGLFLALLAATLFLLDGALLGQVTKQSIDVTDYLLIAWLGASVATVAGALGSSLENDEEVREAAYGYRQRERMDAARDNDDDERHEPRGDRDASET